MRSKVRAKSNYSKFIILGIITLLISTIIILIPHPTKLGINEIGVSSGQPRALDITNTVGAYMEIPPYVLTSGYKQLNFTTNFGYGCSTPANLLTDKIVLNTAHCVPTLKANTLSYSPDKIPSDQDWKRNYNGIFTMHAIQKNSRLTLISFDHGENKNEIVNDKLYQNTVNPSLKVKDCASGYVNGAYKDCWESYNAFVNLSWQYLDSEHGFGMKDRIEEGPIVWPQNGYFQNGIRKSYGLRHPYGLVKSDYMYVFYNDASLEGSGIKVARSPLSAAGKPGTFKSYCNGKWIDSLPTGFDKSKMSNFYNKSGGCATNIVPSSNSQISFSVAEQSTGGFLGVAEESDGVGADLIKLYSSTDLVNWTFVKTAYQTDQYSNNLLHYPIFLNQQGTASSRFNPNNFYLLGASGGKAYVLNISLAAIVPSIAPGSSQIYNLFYQPTDRYLLTTNDDEKNVALTAGWVLSGSSFKGWKTPSEGLVPVYRLRNLDTNEYAYIASDNEKTLLESQGWGSEGVSFYAYNLPVPGSIPVYKLVKDGAIRKYRFTTSDSEKQAAISSGYTDQGISFYVSP